MRAVPGFFLVGAPKAGTTSLYRYLSQHPAVFMSPVKEPSFFVPELMDFTPGKRRDGIVLDWAKYLTLFAGAGAATAIGEASVLYLASTGAAREIHRRVPQARILMVLRDPAERLFSHYAAAVAAGATRARFLEWVDAHRALDQSGRPPLGPIAAGCYAAQLRRYLDVFPASQVQVHLFDDFRREPSMTMASIFRFLGVDDRWPIDVTQRHNATTVPRWPALERAGRPILRRVARVLPRSLVERARQWSRVPLGIRSTPVERRRAIELYDADIRALGALIDRDLSSWLTV